VSAREILTLLDPDAMQRCLQAIPVFAERLARLGSVSFERLWAKPGRHFHVSYRVRMHADGGTVETLASASLLRADATASDVVGPAVEVPSPEGLPGSPGRWSARLSTAVLDAPRILVQLFPWDYRLPTLALALDPASVESRAGLASIRSCALAGYWPGMRCNVRYELGREPRVLYGKVFPAGMVEAAAANQAAVARAVEPAGALTVPGVYAHVPELSLLLTEPVDGERFLDRLQQGDGDVVIGRVAAALAAFHALSVPGIEKRFRPEDDVAVVEPWVALVGAVLPELAAMLEGSATDVREGMPADDPARAALVHRDFYDKQILVAPARVGLLDLDTACLGDPEIDVANFCAHLRLRSLQWHSSSDAARPLTTRFLAAYRACRPCTDMHRVRWYLASALLRLACLYSLRPSWQALAPRLLEESRQALRAGGPEP